MYINFAEQTWGVQAYLDYILGVTSGDLPEEYAGFVAYTNKVTNYGCYCQLGKNGWARTRKGEILVELNT